MKDILSLLTKLPPEVLAAIADLLRAVVTSEDPKRTAERHAKMIAAREVSRRALRKALP